MATTLDIKTIRSTRSGKRRTIQVTGFASHGYHAQIKAGGKLIDFSKQFPTISAAMAEGEFLVHNHH